MAKSRLTASALGAALVVGIMTLPSFQTGTAYAAGNCVDDGQDLRILSFNDFHGRLHQSSPDTLSFFGSLEQKRAETGADNTLVVSVGDNVGASLFNSMVQSDDPTIDLLNVAKVDVAALGNHELDKGFADLQRIENHAQFKHVSANLLAKDGSSGATNGGAYQIFERAGVKIAVIGAVTNDLPALINPSVFDSVQLSEAVPAVNKHAKALKDGDPSNGEADIVIAAYHEGAAGGQKSTIDQQRADSATFARIVNETAPEVDLILNGHTHKDYVYEVNGRIVMQSGSYASHLGVTDLKVGKDNTGKNVICATPTAKNTSDWNAWKADKKDSNETKAAKQKQRDEFVAKYASQYQPVLDQALAVAKEVGSVQLATATMPITRGLDDSGNENRGVRSTMSDMVAQMFYEEVGAKGANVIGVQNPGGTRADLIPDANGAITYEQVAAVLPFANSVMTTELTGAQVKTMLEQQWQPDGASRPVLMLGLSDNVSYSYDESRPKGDRITEIIIDGQPYDPAVSYTMVSGDFLIGGGDNFSVFTEGGNRQDSGRGDLEAWSAWVKQKALLTPVNARMTSTFEGLPGESIKIDAEVENPHAIYHNSGYVDEAGNPVFPMREAFTTVEAFWPGGAKVGQATLAVGAEASAGRLMLAIPGDAAPGVHQVSFVVTKANGVALRYVTPVTVQAPTAAEPQTPTPSQTPSAEKKPSKPTKLPNTGSGVDLLAGQA